MNYCLYAERRAHPYQRRALLVGWGAQSEIGEGGQRRRGLPLWQHPRSPVRVQIARAEVDLGADAEKLDFVGLEYSV